jgi:hypothetical protein
MASIYAPDGSIRVTATDMEAYDDQYSRATAVSSTPGQGLLINTGTAGIINVTFANGGTVPITVGVGTTILPLSVTAASAGTATGATFFSLFHI